MSLTVTVSPFSSPQVIGYYVACTAYDPIIPVVCVLTVDSLELIIFPFHHKETRVPLVNAVQISFPAIDKESPTFPSAMCLLVSLFYRRRERLTIPFDGDGPIEKIHLRSCLILDEKQMIRYYKRQVKECKRQVKKCKQETEELKREVEEYKQEAEELKQEAEEYKQEAEELKQEAEELKQEAEEYTQEVEELIQEAEEHKRETKKYKQQAQETRSDLAAALQRDAQLERTPKKRKWPKGSDL